MSRHAGVDMWVASGVVGAMAMVLLALVTAILRDRCTRSTPLVSTWCGDLWYVVTDKLEWCMVDPSVM